MLGLEEVFLAEVLQKYSYSQEKAAAWAMQSPPQTVAHRGTYCHLKEYLPSLMLQIKYNWAMHNVSPHICFLQWLFAM